MKGKVKHNLNLRENHMDLKRDFFSLQYTGHASAY